jgi:hypothetical protein
MEVSHAYLSMWYAGESVLRNQFQLKDSARVVLDKVLGLYANPRLSTMGYEGWPKVCLYVVVLVGISISGFAVSEY